jgi:hypothetical protein
MMLCHKSSICTSFILPYLLQGQRLGSAAELPQSKQATQRPSGTINNRYDETPKPMVDSNLTEEEKQRIREERAAAAEARARKQQIGGKSKKKKKNVDSSAPLRGPNSKNTMTWTVG